MSHRNPLRFCICVQLFPLVIYWKRSQRHLLGDKWRGAEKKKGQKEMPMDTLTAALTGSSWKWWQVDDKWQISGCLSRRRWADTFISFGFAGCRCGLSPASLRSAFPLLPAQLCTHGFSRRGRETRELCARNESTFVFCFIIYLFFVVTDKYWVIILTHIHLRLTQAMLASILQLPTFEMRIISHLAICALVS